MFWCSFNNAQCTKYANKKSFNLIKTNMFTKNSNKSILNQWIYYIPISKNNAK